MLNFAHRPRSFRSEEPSAARRKRAAAVGIQLVAHGDAFPHRQGETRCMSQRTSLDALAREQLELAVDAGGGRTARTVYGGHEKVLRQTLIAMISGSVLAEHENPGEATVLVLRGRGATGVR